MSGICSKHLGHEADCKTCNAKPWELLNTSQKDWEAHKQYAKSEGTMTCPLCGFASMYRRTCRQDDGKYLCPCCGRYFDGQ